MYMYTHKYIFRFLFPVEDIYIYISFMPIKQLEMKSIMKRGHVFDKEENSPKYKFCKKNSAHIPSTELPI